jgi:hypothetical protein
MRFEKRRGAVMEKMNWYESRTGMVVLLVVIIGVLVSVYVWSEISLPSSSQKPVPVLSNPTTMPAMVLSEAATQPAQ